MPAQYPAPEMITKRDGRQVPFDLSRIVVAVGKCLRSTMSDALVDLDAVAKDTADSVVRVLSGRFVYGAAAPHVEQVQDVVETILMGTGFHEAARHYVLYRAEHARLRAERDVSPEVRAAFAESSACLADDPLRVFQYFDKYARFDHGKGRRETWPETVDRSLDYLAELAAGRLDAGMPDVWDRLRKAIVHQDAMPSMRLLAMAGAAARRQNASIYNCTYLPLRDLRAFEEILLLSMAGCGVGFSVEGQYVYELPFVRRQGGRRAAVVVEDSTEGWGAALLESLQLFFDGADVDLDTSRVRPAGAALLTKGGRASGPGPLRTMIETIRGVVLRRQGAMLRPIDAHDIACAVGLAAVSGGMRRTAMISLFDHDDEEMLHAKDGDFPNIRWNANNSAVWPSNITQAQVMGQMLSMARDRRGEPGIFNRDAATRLRPGRRAARDVGGIVPVYGTNPCGEIILRPYEMCNLSIAVSRAGDNFAALAAKVEAATIIGTIQSLATHFPGLRPDWARNCELERLLGVDLTAPMDCAAARDPEVLRQLRGVAERVNAETAALLGIAPSAAITCNKPGGNSSAFLGCASGIHGRWSKYQIKRCRVSAHSPTYQVLRDAAVPMTPENGQAADTADTWVVAIPVAAPEGAILRDDLSAIDQCEAWLRAKLNWTEHNPSCTIYYRDDELLPLTAWVWEHRDAIGGLSFFPRDGANYDQPPNEEIDRETYDRMVAAFPRIDWSKLVRYERFDTTTASAEVACVAGACEWEPPRSIAAS